MNTRFLKAPVSIWLKVRGSFITVDEIPDCREGFVSHQEIRAESGGQQRKFKFFSLMVWGHVQEHALSPELSLAACSGGQLTAALGLCTKIVKNMRNDLLEQPWLNLLLCKCSGRCCQKELNLHRNTTAWNSWEEPAVKTLRLGWFSFFSQMLRVRRASGAHFDTGFLFGAVD